MRFGVLQSLLFELNLIQIKEIVISYFAPSPTYYLVNHMTVNSGIDASHQPSVVSMPLARVFFPNLNGLRFLAVLLVVVDHVEGIRSACKLSNYWAVPAIPLLGQLGVDFFLF